MTQSVAQRKAMFARLHQAGTYMLGMGTRAATIGGGAKMAARLGRKAGIFAARRSRPAFRRLGKYAGRQLLQAMHEGSTPRLAYGAGLAYLSEGRRFIPKIGRFGGAVVGAELAYRGLRIAGHQVAVKEAAARRKKRQHA